MLWLLSVSTTRKGLSSAADSETGTVGAGGAGEKRSFWRGGWGATDHAVQIAGWAVLFSYLTLSQEIISHLGSRLTGSWSDPQVLPDVAQLCLQGEILYKEGWGWGWTNKDFCSQPQFYGSKDSKLWYNTGLNWEKKVLFTCSLARNSAAGSTSEVAGISNSSSKSLMIAGWRLYLFVDCLGCISVSEYESNSLSYLSVSSVYQLLSIYWLNKTSPVVQLPSLPVDYLASL